MGFVDHRMLAPMVVVAMALGCGTTSAPTLGPPPVIDETGNLALTPMAQDGFVDIKVTTSFDAIALEVSDVESPSPTALFSMGMLCSKSSNMTACQDDVRRGSKTGWTRLAVSGVLKTVMYVMYTAGNDVTRILDKPALLAFLGPIDTPHEAVLVATLETAIIDEGIGARAPTNKTQTYRVLDDGYEIVSSRHWGCGEARYRVRVTRDGVVTVVDPSPANNYCEG